MRNNFIKSFQFKPVTLKKLIARWPISASYFVKLNRANTGAWQFIIIGGRNLPEKGCILFSYSSDLEARDHKRFLSCRIKIRKHAYFPAIVYISNDVETIQFDFVSDSFEQSSIRLWFLSLPRFIAAVALISSNPSIFLSTFRGGIRGFVSKIRDQIGSVEVASLISRSYSNWIELFEHWPTPNTSTTKPILVIIFKNGNTEDLALAATITSLNQSNVAIRIETFNSTLDHAKTTLSSLFNESSEIYTALLQAGEVINPKALNIMLNYAVENKSKAIYADEDCLDEHGIRHTPLFKPQPNRTLMLSGSLTRGLWLFEQAVLRETVNAHRDHNLTCAEALRLDAWLRLDAAGECAFTQRLPFVLTHRRHDTICAPPAVLHAIVLRHLGADWQGYIDSSNLPLKIRPDARTNLPKIAIIIPTTARMPHVNKCIAKILANTSYQNFELILVISQNNIPDSEQNIILGPLLADPRVHLVHEKMDKFNYSKANNAGVSKTDAPLICLMNDDVAPINPDWLNIMSGHFQDERTAIIGAKLYYENNTIQHAGIIMGSDTILDHAFRFLPRDESGYADRAALDQEMSAVTGACLLVRKDIYNKVGGLDETLPVSFNDVEFCMQVRSRNYAIVFCARAELYHYETLSLGQHYAGDRINQDKIEINRIRKSWKRTCENDPFYNPNFSLETGQQWQLGFPPRIFRGR